MSNKREKAVELALNGLKAKEIAAYVNANLSTVQSWLSPKRRMLSDYGSTSREKKLRAIARATEVGVSQAAHELGVSKSALYQWRKAYEMYGDTPPNPPSIHAHQHTLEQVYDRLTAIECLLEQILEKLNG